MPCCPRIESPPTLRRRRAATKLAARKRDEFERGIEALLHHSIIDALFEAQLRGPIRYNEEGHAILVKAVEDTLSNITTETLDELTRRWVDLALANGLVKRRD